MFFSKGWRWIKKKVRFVLCLTSSSSEIKNVQDFLLQSPLLRTTSHRFCSTACCPGNLVANRQDVCVCSIGESHTIILKRPPHYYQWKNQHHYFKASHYQIIILWAKFLIASLDSLLEGMCGSLFHTSIQTKNTPSQTWHLEHIGNVFYPAMYTTTQVVI